MKTAALEKISTDRLGGSGYFPFSFRREPRARPLCVGVSFVVAHVANRFVEPNAPPAGQRVIPPLAIALLPVKGRVPRVRGELIPTIREPKLRVLVAAIVDELEILAISHAAGSKLERLQVNLVARLLVVEREACAGS